MEQITKRLFNWASILEPNTLEQARRTSPCSSIHRRLRSIPQPSLRLDMQQLS